MRTFLFFYENKIMTYSCIKAETTSDEDYVRFSAVKPKVKAALCMYPRMHTACVLL